MALNSKDLNLIMCALSEYAKAIARLKKMLVKHLGVYELLIAFRDKHVRGTEALQDFEIILNKIDK